MEGMVGFDYIGSGAKAIASLCFVLALMVLLVLAMKKMTVYRHKGQKDLGIKRISSMPLSAKERIDVVEVLGQRLVLGVAQSGINLLLKLQVGEEPKGKEDAGKS